MGMLCLCFGYIINNVIVVLLTMILLNVPSYVQTGYSTTNSQCSPLHSLQCARSLAHGHVCEYLCAPEEPDCIWYLPTRVSKVKVWMATRSGCGGILI